MDVKSLLILKCFFLLILYFNPTVEGDISYGLCANSECSEPVGRGITVIRYASPDDNRISVEANDEVDIYVKDYGPKKDLWGVMVRGNKGYISKSFIRETQSLVKKLVPANIEFKTSLLVTSDHVGASYLHESTHLHQPESISSYIVPGESIIHTQTYQHNVENAIPRSHQKKKGHSENIQAPNLSPNFKPSESLQASHLNFNPSENRQASHLNFNPSEDLQASHLNFNPSDNVQFDFHSKFSQPSHLHPELSSHFDSGNNIASSHVTGKKSANILPSQSQVPNMKDSSLYEDNSLLSPTYSESGVNFDSNFDLQNSLDFSDSDIYDPSSVYPSQSYPSFNQHPSSVQNQQFKSPHVPKVHSSLYSDDSFDLLNDDYLETLSMLSEMGFDNSDMYPDSQSHQSSQNIKTDFDVSKSDFNKVPSQIQHSSIHSSDTSLHSSINSIPSSSIENKIVNSEAPKIIRKPPQSTDIKTDNIVGKKPVVEDLMEKIESEIDVDFKGEEEEEEEEEDKEEEDSDEDEDFSMVDDTDLSFENVESSKTEFHLKSSMSSTLMNEPSTKIYKDAQIPLKSNVDFDLDKTLYVEHSTSVKEEKASLLLNEFPLKNEPMQPDTKISEEPLIIHTTVQTSKHSEYVEDSNLSKNDVKGTHGVISNVVAPDENKNSTESDVTEEKSLNIVNESLAKKDVFSDISERNNNDALQTESNVYDPEHTTLPVNEFFVKNEQNSELNEILNTIDIDSVHDGVRSAYQIRNLKGEYTANEDQQPDSEAGNDENNTETDSGGYNSFENGLNALKSFVDFVMSWIPEPLYSVLMDLQNKGISPRVPVFTVLCGIVCILLIVPLFFIKECSKENRLSTQLASVEKTAYTLSATNTVLEEKLESVQIELSTLQAALSEEKTFSESLKSECESQAEELERTKAELESCLEELDSLKEKENEYLSLLNDHEKGKENLLEHKCSLDKIITDQENSIASLNDQLQEYENHIKEFEREKQQNLQMKEDYEEKIAQFDRNCNQLLQEAEVWNLRVNELTSNLNEERTLKEELEVSLKEKNEEIESLKQLVETFKTYEEIEDPEDETKTKEEKLQSLINSAKVLNQLKREEDVNKVLDEQLSKEKDKILELEVELLDAKSEIDKLKISYNQALQDKAEAQTKLDVLTNYFKDKEIQLQKQLGAQEAVRQKKEEDANSAERRICLIDQENASYKYQVASMKQEMEETERNLKSQIAVQEKKAHENWIAARAAERKLDDMKQEVTQLRQRLTLLEREQENWANSSRDDIIRPVPKRIPGLNEESGNQDMNTSERGMFPPPPLHDRLPPVPPMILPPDRPLPPLLPPPIPPMFLPPMERHFRPQPWHLPPDPSSDYRTTPPEFIGGRESTPPRGRQSTITDGDTGPNTSSPLTTDTRDSRNSTPPHLLPDFHDVPPQPGRPFFPPPPLGHPRLPMHPPYRRDPLPKRLDNSNEYNSRGPQPPPPQEQWQHSRV